MVFISLFFYFTVNWFINFFLLEVYDAHTVITKMNSYILAFSFYDTLNRVLSGVSYIILTYFTHSKQVQTVIRITLYQIDHSVTEHTQMKYIAGQKKVVFPSQNKRGNEKKKAEISSNIILASETDEKFKTFS